MTALCKSEFRNAVDRSKVDLDDPAVIAWAAMQGLTLTEPEPEKPKPPENVSGIQTETRTPQNDPYYYDPWAEYADMTVRDVVNKFGTDQQFKEFLEAQRKAENVRDLRTKTDERAGKLIPRDLVSGHLFGAMEAANVRVLTEAPKTIAVRVSALVKTDAPPEECERIIRDILSKQFREVKRKAVEILGPDPSCDD